MADAFAELTSALEQDLIQRFGVIIGGDDLRMALGFESMDAFNKAFSRRQLPVPVFPLKFRRGKYALAKDVAPWLATARGQAQSPGTDAIR